MSVFVVVVVLVVEVLEVVCCDWVFGGGNVERIVLTVMEVVVEVVVV